MAIVIPGIGWMLVFQSATGRHIGIYLMAPLVRHGDIDCRQGVNTYGMVAPLMAARMV
jgi:hypothetical protein